VFKRRDALLQRNDQYESETGAHSTSLSPSLVPAHAVRQPARVLKAEGFALQTANVTASAGFQRGVR
jgi:hypothetical protein